MFYIEKEGRIVLYNEDLTKIQNTLLCMPQYQGLEIQETERPIVDFQFADTPEYIAEQIEKRTEQFHRDFFETSLGWIRRKVTMKDTGETKDFLTDLLPTIAVASLMGRTANVITYSEPDFTQDVVNWEELQEIKPISPVFITECANQTDTDFTGIIHALVGLNNDTIEGGNTSEEEPDNDDNIDDEVVDEEPVEEG